MQNDTNCTKYTSNGKYIFPTCIAKMWYICDNVVNRELFKSGGTQMSNSGVRVHKSPGRLLMSKFKMHT